MRDFFIPLLIATFAGLAWIALWAWVLRWFGIHVYAKSAEAKALTCERFIAMGMTQFIFVFGMLGFGTAFGLGISIVARTGSHPDSWARTISQFLLAALFGGYLHGLFSWDRMVAKPTPFPPEKLYPK